MSVRGKSRDDWVAVTLTDFAVPGQRHEIRHHYSVEAAARSWDSILRMYGRTWSDSRPRVWQETRDGTLINETLS